MRTDVESLKQVTPLILTYNEEANISRTLSRLSWAHRIVVIDSYSDDETLVMISKYSQADVFKRKFDSHHNQWNYGLEQVKTEWVLSLDADYLLSEGLVKEMIEVIPSTDCDGFLISLHFCVDGKPLKCSILTPRIALFRKEEATYYQDGHTQRMRAHGKIGSLKSPIYHDDRKPFSSWLRAQRQYAEREVEKLFGKNLNELRIVDRLRKLIFVMPILMSIYILLFKRGFLDGSRGVYYAYLRTYYEFLLAGKVLRRYVRSIFRYSHSTIGTNRVKV